MLRFNSISIPTFPLWIIRLLRIFSKTYVDTLKRKFIALYNELYYDKNSSIISRINFLKGTNYSSSRPIYIYLSNLISLKKKEWKSVSRKFYIGKGTQVARLLRSCSAIGAITVNDKATKRSRGCSLVSNADRRWKLHFRSLGAIPRETNIDHYFYRRHFKGKCDRICEKEKK